MPLEDLIGLFSWLAIGAIAGQLDEAPVLRKSVQLLTDLPLRHLLTRKEDPPKRSLTQNQLMTLAEQLSPVPNRSWDAGINHFIDYRRCLPLLGKLPVSVVESFATNSRRHERRLGSNALSLAEGIREIAASAGELTEVEMRLQHAKHDAS